MENIKIILQNKLKNINLQIKNATKFEEMGSSESDATQEYENFAQNQAMLQPLEEEKKGITSALKRIDDGSYNVCSSCKKNIEHGRLQAFPTADKCVTCAAKR